MKCPLRPPPASRERKALPQGNLSLCGELCRALAWRTGTFHKQQWRKRCSFSLLSAPCVRTSKALRAQLCREEKTPAALVAFPAGEGCSDPPLCDLVKVASLLGQGWEMSADLVASRPLLLSSGTLCLLPLDSARFQFLTGAQGSVLPLTWVIFLKETPWLVRVVPSSP